MSTQKEQDILNKWQERFDDIVSGKTFYGLADLEAAPHNEGMVRDAQANPNIARKLSNMLLKAIEDSKKTAYVVHNDFASYQEEILWKNENIFLDLGEIDGQIYTDYLNFKEKNGFTFASSFRDYKPELYWFPAVDEGKLEAKLLYRNIKNCVGTPPKREELNPYFNTDYHWEEKQYAFNKRASMLIRSMAKCVAKDLSLAKDFFNFTAELKNADITLFDSKTLCDLSNQKDRIPEEFFPLLIEAIKKDKIRLDGRYSHLQEAMFNIIKHDTKYLSQCQELGYKIEKDKDAILVAEIYEKLQQKAHDNFQETDFAKNVSADILTPEERKTAYACEKLLGKCSGKKALVVKVKLSGNYPFSTEKLNVEDNDYVRMCINNLEHPEKENIRSILNRLEETGAKDHVDFMNAVDFVHRRDMFKKICNNFNIEHGYKKENCDIISADVIDPEQLSYSMAESGIKDKKTAEKVVELFSKLNERPLTFGSSYNSFYPDALKKMVELEDWMLPVVKRAVECGVVQAANLGNPTDLFAACKAWKINPNMPKTVAEQVGEMSLSKRMVAGAIVDRINEKTDLGKHKELIPEFWKEMARAQEMTFPEAMKTYIPDTKINRKRFTAAMLEEMGIESNSEKFKNAYQKLEYEKGFEKFLAAKGEAQTVIPTEQMLKLAELKKRREKVHEKMGTKPSQNPRRRLVEKGLLPLSGKFGEGHQISIPVKDMSQFKSFTH